MLKAINEIDTTSSLVGYALFAAIPSAPPAPTSDASVTNKDRIKVLWTEIASPDNGYHEIISYSLEMDDGAGGDFVVLTGTDADPVYLKLTYTVYTNITEGVDYRFRYRGKNLVGWGAYSPVSYIRAATVPSKPVAPQLTAATATGVTLSLTPT